MNQVKLPTNVLASINPNNFETQVVDDAGQVKGYLISAEYRALVYSWVKSLFDDAAELQTARAETGGYTTAEAVNYLRQLEAKHEGRP